MDLELYDEFGNFIGEYDDGDNDEEADELEADFQHDRDGGGGGDARMVVADDTSNALAIARAHDENRIVLHEDKRYYPDAEEVYPGVRTAVLDEDAQDISEPIIKPIKVKNFSVLDKDAPVLTYSNEFLAALMNTPTLVRNVAILGHLHHGKTTFVDTLVQATQEKEWDPSREKRFSDTRKDEQERELSIKSTCLSLVLENLKAKSYLLNLLDCPGHVNFSDESTAALRSSDGAVVVVDAVEGVMLSTVRLVKQAISARVPVTLVINKVDRLILELKLPPQDAYFKLLHTIEEVNAVIADELELLATAPGQAAGGPAMRQVRLSPEKGNVCFASAQHGWSFTLPSFAEMYVLRMSDGSNGSGSRAAAAAVPADELAKRLWGDWYHDPEQCTFTKKKPSSGAATRTFVQFILEPLYKMYSQAVGETPEDLARTLKALGVRLTPAETHMDPKPLLRLCLSRFFGYPRGFVEMVTKYVPSPVESAATKVALYYTGYQTSAAAVAMRACKADGPLIANVVKLYNTPDGTKFLALARIYSGTVRTGQRVRVLGEGFSQEDDEDMAVAEVAAVAVGVGRFSIEVSQAVAGNCVLLDGIDAPIKKTATIVDMQETEAAIFRPLKFDNCSVVKLAVEPLKPAELPKMVEALRRVNKSYPLVTTKVEESGEHVIFAPGELCMDCVMHDLRHLYGDIEVKVADPVVPFNETVVESSTLKCFSETPNKRNRLTMIAEPLEDGLAADIEHEAIALHWDKKTVGDFFRGKYDWDLLAARSVWAFGPDAQGPNLILDDTLPSEVDKGLLGAVKDSVVQGFKWGCREGPLCDEPIRNVKFKILDATIAAEPIHRGGGQVIPAARRAAYSAFLMATPRLMEPVYLVEIQAPADCVQAIYPVLARRRGHIVQDAPKPGAPFYTIKAYLPVMDAFGFETDLRSYTQGLAFCQQVFDHWSVVPGDPLDRNVVLHPLEPSPPMALARDFMVKTRRRKGLSEDVSHAKYFDEQMLAEIARQEAGDEAY